MKRLSAGGRIDRTRPLTFRWDGRELSGFAGDTLASALLGAGITVIGTSVSLERPRGIMSAGFEEAHGFAQVGTGGSSEPLVRDQKVHFLRKPFLPEALCEKLSAMLPAG